MYKLSLCYAALLEFSPAQALVRITLPGDTDVLTAGLAKLAASRWEQEQHPGWSAAGVDSCPLLAQLDLIQVFACACMATTSLGDLLDSSL